MDVSWGYRAQDADRAQRVAQGERVVGAKMGLTSRAKQATMGVDQPIAGFLTDAMRLPAGHDDDLFARTAQPRIEPEIAFRLGTVVDRPLTMAAAAETTDGIAAAVEIIDSRYTGYVFRLPDVVADNTSAAAFVIGDGSVRGLPATSPRCAASLPRTAGRCLTRPVPRSSDIRCRLWSACPSTWLSGRAPAARCRRARRRRGGCRRDRVRRGLPGRDRNPGCCGVQHPSSTEDIIMTTALLIIDMQNDTAHADGAYASFGVAMHATSQNVIANVCSVLGARCSVLGAARAVGAPVFHTRIAVHPVAGLGGANAPIFRMLAPDTFKLGSWGAAIVDELTPVAGEVVLDRIRMNAFGGTSLDIMLRNLGVTRLVVVGAWTNMAVEHSVRDAADHGYEVTIVSDATSSLSDEWQQAALGYALTNIATIVGTTEVAASFQS
jgi:ureidoacrylate peracid hydrolase